MAGTYTGTGTESDPFIVDNYADLMTCVVVEDAYIELGADIGDVADGDWDGNVQWACKQLDGKNHKCRNITMKQNWVCYSNDRNWSTMMQIKNTNFVLQNITFENLFITEALSDYYFSMIFILSEMEVHFNNVKIQLILDSTVASSALRYMIIPKDDCKQYLICNNCDFNYIDNNTTFYRSCFEFFTEGSSSGFELKDCRLYLQCNKSYAASSNYIIGGGSTIIINNSYLKCVLNDPYYDGYCIIGGANNFNFIKNYINVSGDNTSTFWMFNTGAASYYEDETAAKCVARSFYVSDNATWRNSTDNPNNMPTGLKALTSEQAKDKDTLNDVDGLNWGIE